MPPLLVYPPSSQGVDPLVVRPRDPRDDVSSLAAAHLVAESTQVGCERLKLLSHHRLVAGDPPPGGGD